MFCVQYIYSCFDTKNGRITEKFIVLVFQQSKIPLMLYILIKLMHTSVLTLLSGSWI
jgi:hypothetical protein